MIGVVVVVVVVHFAASLLSSADDDPLCGNNMGTLDNHNVKCMTAHDHKGGLIHYNKSLNSKN
jgi:hypothetical protein